MNPPAVEKLRTMLSQGNWDRAINLLQRIDPPVAADVLMSLPFEEQRTLFQRLPIDLAAALAAADF